MTVPWTRFILQVPRIRDTVEYYLNTLGTGPVERGGKPKPAPWHDAWFWDGRDGHWRPREGEAIGHLTAKDLAEFEKAGYAGLGGYSESWWYLTCRPPSTTTSSS